MNIIIVKNSCKNVRKVSFDVIGDIYVRSSNVI